MNAVDLEPQDQKTLSRQLVRLAPLWEEAAAIVFWQFPKAALDWTSVNSRPIISSVLETSKWCLREARAHSAGPLRSN